MRYFLITMLCLLATDAHAYIDPASGSFIIQALLAAIMGGVLAIGLYWRKVKNFFAKLFQHKTNRTKAK